VTVSVVVAVAPTKLLSPEYVAGDRIRRHGERGQRSRSSAVGSVAVQRVACP